jgi:hypothetical protein
MPGTSGASLGAIGVEVDRAYPCPSNDTGGLFHDLVMHGTSLGMPGSTAPGDAIPAPESSGAVGPGVAGLLLPGSLGFLPPPID